MNKKPPKRSGAKRRASSSRESVAALKKTIATQAQELQLAAEQQTATSEILRVIASSPTDLKRVLDVLAENAARLCDTDDAAICRVVADQVPIVAHYGLVAATTPIVVPLSRDSVTGRSIIERKTMLVNDWDKVSPDDYPMGKELARVHDVRMTLATPLMRKGVAIGAIVIRRKEYRPFTESQIKLLETFADQAVIAIENVRLFQELKESLEHQTATSEILRVIASSPTDLQPVLDTVAENAAGLCEADDAQIARVDGDILRVVASYGPIPASEDRVINRWFPSGRAIVDRQTIHVHDLAAEIETEYPESRLRRERRGIRTILVTPLLREDVVVGLIAIRRTEVCPFTDKQIALLKTFADQAVIAIENVRLFKELQERNRDLTEALEQQTATGEVLRVIASSPTELQPVLDTLIANAVRLSGGTRGHVWQFDGEFHRVVANYGETPEMITTLRTNPLPASPELPAARALLGGKPVHILDVQSETGVHLGLARQMGTRTLLSAPLMREGTNIGSLNIWRDVVEPFTGRQVELVKTFADQAVIAIENVRLFKELQERNADLREALEHQTATAEVLGIISRSPTDVQPVLDAIVESAARVCGIDDVLLRLRENDMMTVRAHFGPVPTGRPEISMEEPQYRWISKHGALHIPDTQAQNEFPRIGSVGNRTYLAVPLHQHEEFVGVLAARRMNVRPFTAAQTKLLQTFADQAVIAIENVRLFQELKESLEQQTATSEVLGVIASSPTDIKPVLDTVAANAARLCEATDAQIRLVEGERTRLVASFGDAPAPEFSPITPGRVSGRAVLNRETIQVHDLLEASKTDFPDSKDQVIRTGTRTILSTPMVREGTAIGLINIRRTVVRPFSERQVKLLETFASQAAIAIENVRLFKELQERNRDLTEALEQQTATSEILRVIAGSPTDIRPVLDAVAKNAARLCEAIDAQIRLVEGDGHRLVASFGPVPAPEFVRTTLGHPAGRAILNRKTIHVRDLAEAVKSEFPDMARSSGARTFLSTPMLREGIAIGLINIRRTEVHPFSDRQIKLLETFAAQAVIAIENVRLFKELEERNSELREALEHQTATSAILGVIASSPTDIQPVLDVVAENAATLCDATDGQILRVEGNILQREASYGSMAFPLTIPPISRGTPIGRAVLDRQPIHVHDVAAEIETEFPESKNMQENTGTRTILVVPLLRESIPIGIIAVRRTDVRPFTDKQIALLKTFADQAVIAIENVRLFKELEARNCDLTEALEQQTATSEILGVIASSPTDLEPVFKTILHNAVRLCEARNGAVFRFDGEVFRAVAYNMVSPTFQAYAETTLIRPGRESALRRVGLEKRPVHIPDILADPECVVPEPYRQEGIRTAVAVPLLKETNLIGAFAIHRQEVRPFTETQIRLLETFASQAVIAIENVRLFQELQERTRELVESVEEMNALSEVGQAVSSTLDLEKVLETIVSRAVDLSGTDCGVIYEFDESTQEFNLRASHHMEAEAVEALKSARIRLGEGATGQAASTRTPVQISDTFEQRVGAVSRLRPLLNRLGYRSLLTVPILREQQIMGGLNVWRRQVGEFAPEVVNLLQTFATQSALAIQNARLFREIEDKSRQIEAANRHKSEFLANVSHELRTPLNAIIGFSEVLQERMFGELNDKQAEYTDDILSSGRHLLSLINDILDLSKIEAGHMELEVTTFDLPLAIENALTLIRERASRHCIKLNRVIDDRLGDFTGDERKVKQILVNLLTNAVKFTPEGGQIKVEAGVGDNAIIVSVTDNGVGIAPEDQGTIFEEFRQVGHNYAHKREGTGLGLTLTRKFVEMHGGKIWIESEVGKGSKFTFTLPVH